LITTGGKVSRGEGKESNTYSEKCIILWYDVSGAIDEEYGND
jgi:hypothetical protein